MPRLAALLVLAALAGCRATETRGPGAAAGVAGGPAEEPGDGDEEDGRVSASVSARYRARFGDGERDHDVTSVVALDAGDPARDPASVHVLASLRAELDDADADEPFFELSDTYDGALSGHVHHAYVDLHGAPELEVARVGRQLLVETPEVAWLDGARLESAPRGQRAWRGGAYAGVPVTFHEASHAGDLAVGLYAEARPWRDLRARVDWMHVDDARVTGGHDDDLWSLALWWLPDEAPWSLEARHTRLEAEARDLRLAARWFEAEEQLALEASYYELLEGQRDLSEPLDPFTTTLLELLPYRQASLLASKGFDDHLHLQAGVDVRRLSDPSDEGPFNRDFERGFATATLPELLPDDVVLAATAEVWSADTADVETWGLDLSKELDERWRGSVGSYYSLYKASLELDDERVDVRTWYADLRRRGGAATWHVRYELEDGDVDLFHVLRVGVTWRR